MYITNLSSTLSLLSNFKMSFAALFTAASTALVTTTATSVNRYPPHLREYTYCDKQVRDLLSADYFATINLRPGYQRHIRWKPDAMNKFIDSVMKKRYIMPVLTYMLHPQDLTGKYTSDTIFEIEVMDGQHRLYTLNAFRSAKLQKLPHVSKPFIVHWVYEETDENGFKTTSYIFYEQTDDVENWCRETHKVPQYLTREGKRIFDNTIIKLTTIVSPLSMNERREEFLSLQNGLPVRGSDLLKNEMGCKLIAAFDHYGYETMMDDVFFPHCTKKAPKYWVHWAARCFLLFARFNEEEECHIPASEIFLKGDSHLQKLIKSNHSTLQPSEEEFDAFHDVFLEFIGFLQGLDEALTFNPTQIFTIFYHLCDDKRNIDILRSHMPLFAKAGQRKEVKTLWESTSELEPRRRYFNECLAQLEDMVEPACPMDYKPISKSLRKKVWAKCVDEKCEICSGTIAFDDFEAGHIVARAMGGQTELDNLIPICFDCNRAMGVRNAYEFKRDVYPYA